MENIKVDLELEGEDADSGNRSSRKRNAMLEESSTSLTSKSKSNNRIIGKQQQLEGEEEGLHLREGRKLELEFNNRRTIDLGNGSEVVYYPRFLGYEEAWRCFDYLNTQIPWTRPTIRVFGRSCVQPRDSCYVASEGLPKLVYSGYEPRPYSWHHFPPLLHLLQAVSNAVPGSGIGFNSLLLNRYCGGNDYVGWHSDDESLYGPTPVIASLSFGCDRDFFLKKKPPKSFPSTVLEKKSRDKSVSKRLKKRNTTTDQHSFTLKHGSLLVMRGYTQRDWIHSVPKRAKVDAVRINLTFRLVL